MKKYCSVLLLALLLQLSCTAQKTTFDITSFTAPANWEKAAAGGVVVYTGIDKATNRLCMLSIYKTAPGSGSASADFAREWDNKVVKKFGCSSLPKIQDGEAKSGWQSKIGLNSFSQNGIKMMAILTTLTGEGKTICLLALTNDKAYIGNRRYAL